MELNIVLNQNFHDFYYNHSHDRQMPLSSLILKEESWNRLICIYEKGEMENEKI